MLIAQETPARGNGQFAQRVLRARPQGDVAPRDGQPVRRRAPGKIFANAGIILMSQVNAADHAAAAGAKDAVAQQPVLAAAIKRTAGDRQRTAGKGERARAIERSQLMGG